MDMDFSEWSPIRIIIAMLLCGLGLVGIIIQVKERVENAVFYFRRKALKERITSRGVLRDWVNSETGAFLTVLLLLTLLLVGSFYLIYGKDFFSKEGPKGASESFVITWVVMWVLCIISTESGKVGKRINEVNEQISEMNQRLSDIDTAIRQLNQESDIDEYTKGR